MRTYPWYDPKNRIAILNFRNNSSIVEIERDLIFWQLDRMDVEILDEIKMPLDFNMSFFRAKIPEFLVPQSRVAKKDGVSLESSVFVDDRGRIRLSINLGFIIFSTIVKTRYYPGSVFFANDNGEKDHCRIAAYDRNNPDCHPATIWRGECDPKDIIDGSELTKARIWLDEVYPDWRDPMAYWE